MINLKTYLKIAVLAITLLFTVFTANAQEYIKPPIMQANWSYPYEPFRIVGNLYYVGTYDLACYLITTPKGHILINSGLADATPMIIDHIKSLGFNPSDIKIILATHGHYDHVAGFAELKKITGAKILISKRDASVLADGGNSDYVFGGKGMTFPPVKPDGLLDNDAVVKLGDMKITCVPTPGHTPGATSFLFDVKDEKRTYKVLIANMPTVLDDANLVTGMPLYPDVAKDYAKTFDTMRKLQFDIFLASHAAQFKMQTKHKPGDPYNPDAFIDRKGYDDALDNFYRLYQRKLKQ